jgi:hypothetical protein
MSLKRGFLLNIALLSAAWLPSLAANPSVRIETTFATIGGRAIIYYPNTPSGSFTAKLDNVPTDHGEWKVAGTEYAWTISPIDSSLSFTPTDAVTVNLSLLNSAAWGRRYEVSVAVRWTERNTETGAVNIIQATASMLLDTRPGVAKIQYEQPSGTWNDCPTVLYVLKGSSVTFKAVSTASIAWLSNSPVWSGTSGVSGYGETTAFTFNTLSSSTSDSKTVEASSGPRGNSVTVFIIIYDLTGTLTPVDNFDQRSQLKYGLEELVNLDFKTTPAGITAAQAGGLTWSADKIGKVVNDTGDTGKAKYDAKHIAGDASLNLMIQSGPCKGQSKSYARELVAPSDTWMKRVNPSRVFHKKNIASVGIELYYYLMPNYVSFKNLRFAEGSAPAEDAEGVLATMDAHPTQSPGAIQIESIFTGCRVVVSDRAQVIVVPWNSGDGSYIWNIPTFYIDHTGEKKLFGEKKKHFSQVFVTGRAEQTKDDCFGSAEAGDADSNY